MSLRHKAIFSQGDTYWYINHSTVRRLRFTRYHLSWRKQDGWHFLKTTVFDVISMHTFLVTCVGLLGFGLLTSGQETTTYFGGYTETAPTTASYITTSSYPTPSSTYTSTTITTTVTMPAAQENGGAILMQNNAQAPQQNSVNASESNNQESPQQSGGQQNGAGSPSASGQGNGGATSISNSAMIPQGNNGQFRFDNNQDPSPQNGEVPQYPMPCCKQAGQSASQKNNGPISMGNVAWAPQTNNANIQKSNEQTAQEVAGQMPSYAGAQQQNGGPLSVSNSAVIPQSNNGQFTFSNSQLPPMRQFIPMNGQFTQNFGQNDPSNVQENGSPISMQNMAQAPQSNSASFQMSNLQPAQLNPFLNPFYTPIPAPQQQQQNNAPIAISNSADIPQNNAANVQSSNNAQPQSRTTTTTTTGSQPS